MGSVWLAEDIRLHRQVALKTLRAADDDDAPARARLMREARAAAALNHPHIATVYDVLEDEGQVVIVFEYVEGETLAARLARESLPATEAVEFGCQIAKALVVAHAHGIVHRDLKPANVIVTTGGQLKVLDFGIARVLSTGTTLTSGGHTASGLGFIGTAAYAAPEQMVSSAVDERADLYALGVMLFEMISGRRPFTGSDPVALASSKLGQDAPPLTSTVALVPRDLEQLVASLLARDRDQRPASAADVLGQLRAIHGTPRTGTLAQQSRSRRLAASVAIAALVIGTAGVAVWQMRQISGRQGPVSTAPPVVAVLPLANISGDAAKDFISAGIAESLISSLAALPSVTVLSRASVTEARNRTAESSALARELGATFLVEGSVQESGGRLRVSLRLVRPDRSVAWGDTVEGVLDQFFDLQSRLATVLTSALDVRVSAAERQRMTEPPTSNPEALSAYWRGRALFERRDAKGNLDAAISAFEEAIRLDSRFALAHAALGAGFWSKYNDTRSPEWTQKAIDAGTTALRHDPDRAEVRYTLAVTLAGSGQPSAAIEELQRALAMQPNYDDARSQLGRVLAATGRVDEAITEFKRAITVRPGFWGHYSSMGTSLFLAARYPEAIEALRRATELQPDSAISHQQLGTVYQQVGNKTAALEEYEKALAINPTGQVYSNLGMLRHQQHDYARAVEAYRQAIALRPNSAATHRNLGDARAKLGQRADALTAYRQAVTLAEADLKVNARDPVTLASLAVYLEKAGRDADARTRLEQALTLAPKDNRVLHRSAVVHALAGRSSEAMSALQQAIQLGYSRAAASEDDEFESIRHLPEFAMLVAPSTAGVKTP